MKERGISLDMPQIQPLIIHKLIVLRNKCTTYSLHLDHITCVIFDFDTKISKNYA